MSDDNNLLIQWRGSDVK